MKIHPTERTLTSAWDDLDEGAAPATLQVGSALGPFVMGQVLGRGGMGIVYAATHDGTGAEVALKTLLRVDARAAARLKSEFRHLACIRHPRLVQLFELHTIDSHCFLTMERIDGVSLSDTLAKQTGRDESYEQLRGLFRQVTEGLQALHDEGLLHLDLKPDNVMVDRDGAVRILDFGLVAPLHETGHRARRGIGGTPRYMAPERLQGSDESTSADWYSLGVMLAEQLGGKRELTSDPFIFPRHAPPDLVDLCWGLLEADPEKRLCGEEVATRLGAKTSGTYRCQLISPGSTPIVVGRDAELVELEEALGSSVSGGSNWVRLTGESGIGKTVLLRRFRDTLRHEAGVTVLEGACHERESMPFQGLDGIMEDLAATLAEREASRGHAEQLLFEHALSLSDAFLELCQGPSLMSQPQTPLERRRAAFSAIKSLIASLTRTQSVVLLIDDVHWGDSDGARLLAEILAAPTPRHLLLVTTSRTADSRAPFLEELEAVLGVRGAALRRTSINLGRLPPHHTLACVSPRGEMKNTKQREAIVRASGGLPFLAAALGSHPWAENETPSLLSLVDKRLCDAPPGALEVMRAISLSPSPLPQAVALEQVADARLRGAVLAALRNSDLVRTSGVTPDAPLEPYHALVAKTVQDQLSPELQREIRSRVANSLEEKQLASSEQLAHLFHLAGDSKAARFAPIAAADAERALAFESAAHWYGRSASWIPDDSAEYLPRQARCLEYAGRSAEAAEAYQKCAQLTLNKRSEYVRAAGSSWLNAGHVDRGLAVLVPELEALGIPIPRSEGAAFARSMYLLWQLRKRGTEFKKVPESECDPMELSRVDAVWHAAKVLGAPLPLRGLALQLQCLALSLQTGENLRIARSLAVLGPVFVGTPFEKLGDDWSRRARAIVGSTENDYLRGIILTFDAVRMTAKWDDPERILERAVEAFEILKKERGPIAWEQCMAFTAGLRVREQLGRFDELKQLGTLWLGESTDRGDLFAQAMACQACAMSQLAADMVDEAREFTRRSIARWSQGAFTVQHYYALRFDVQCDLLEGHELVARDKVRRSWNVLKRAQLLRHPISRPEILLLRGIVELAASTASGEKRCRMAEKMAKTLAHDDNPVSRAHGILLSASCSWLRQPSEEALQRIHMAQSAYLHCGQVLQAACTDLLLADVSDNPKRQQRAEACLLALGVKSPRRYMRAHVPFVVGNVPFMATSRAS